VASTELRREADGSAFLALRRPPANAVDLALAEELTERCRELAADPPAAVLLCGVDGVFCAGADLQNPPLGPVGVRAINHLTHELYRLTCPLIGAITGHAIGVGLVIALCCDVRIASDAGRYGLTEVPLGFPYPPATLDLLRAEVSAPAAQRLVLGGRLHDAATCLALGVFDEVLPAGEVLPRAEAETRLRAGFPDGAYAATKTALRAPGLAAMAVTLAAESAAG
jgi:enoyl-CoA hydratase/carnithine racemase